MRYVIIRGTGYMQVLNAKQPSEDRSNQLVSLLLAVADSERLTHRLYTQILSQAVEGTPVLSGQMMTALQEDKDHIDAIDACLDRLGGGAVNSLPATELPVSVGPVTIEKLLAGLRSTEALSVRAYTKICTMALEHDYRVFDISYRNMHDNIQHLEWVNSLLCGRRSPAPIVDQRGAFSQ